MPTLIPKHPFAMKCIFKDCFLVNFAIKPDVLQTALPPSLQADVYQGDSFLSIVIANLQEMRPAFVPHFLGINYYQIVYRAVVRHNENRGVHFLRGDANNPLMCMMGNLFTYFKFHYSAIQMEKTSSGFNFNLKAMAADIHSTFRLRQGLQKMPPASKFKTLEEAKSFLVELYDAYAFDKSKQKISKVHIQRENWELTLAEDSRQEYEWMQQGPLFCRKNTRLDSIFHVQNLPYCWHPLEWVD